MIQRTYRTPFVGRIDELARLDRALESAEGGTPVVVVVSGEAGVGKTRLLEEFAARAARHGARVLAGGCVEVSGAGLPYGPILEAVRELRDEATPTASPRSVRDDELTALLALGDDQISHQG